MRSLEINDIYNQAEGLGFNIGHASADVSVIPEKFIINLIEFNNGLLILEETRLLSLTRTWLKTFGYLLRPDAIRASIPELGDLELRILASFCSIVEDNSKRKMPWRNLVSDIQNLIGDNFVSKVAVNYPQDGLDKYFLAGRIQYRNMSFSDSRKIPNLDSLARINPWIRNRIIYSATSRTDFVTYLHLNDDVREAEVIGALLISRSLFFELKRDSHVIREAIGYNRSA